MATLDQFKLSEAQRRRRTFSKEFKIQKVRELERKESSVSDICKVYQVSDVSVYRWLQLYGSKQSKQEKLIVEHQSDTKQIQDLRRQIAELQRMLGEKQVQLEFKDKMIDLAEQTYGVDIKKKFDSRQFSGSGETGTDSKSA
jgi:transposase